MANATPSRLGAINGAVGTYAAENALFLKLFGGEVFGAFQEANKALDRFMKRKITQGKSATFPITGKASAAFHVPGTELNGTNIINANERVIVVDDKLVADAFIADIDEAKNHYDVRQEYSKQLGRALAIALDKRLLQMGVLAARSAATVTGLNGGTALTNAGYGTTAATLVAGIGSGAQTLDQNDVDDSDRMIFLRPAQYWLLAQYTVPLDTDWGGRGSYAGGTIPEISGVEIVKTNHLPITNIAAITGEQNTYNGNFSTTVGLLCHKSAVGSVILMDLKMQMEYQIQRQGTLMVAGYAMGAGILRPESSVELKTA